MLPRLRTLRHKSSRALPDGSRIATNIITYMTGPLQMSNSYAASMVQTWWAAWVGAAAWLWRVGGTAECSNGARIGQRAIPPTG